MPEHKKRIVIVGGGAAGFFGAITCAQSDPSCEVLLLERTSKLLAKVRVSGGGRCNVTHHCFNPHQLSKFYPRGEKFLKKAFKHFAAADTVAWFEKRGVKLKTEADGRMFPESDTSETIIDCLVAEASRTGVKILRNTGVEAVTVLTEPGAGFRLVLTSGEMLTADKVLISTGGSPKMRGYSWLQDLGHTIVPPVPSLFTFNVPGSPLQDLPGISVGQAKVKVTGLSLEEAGPLLITHWGFSGPAVLKTSAWGARLLHGMNYQFTALINWVPAFTEESLRSFLRDYRQQYPKRIVLSNPLFNLSQRLWKALAALAEIPEKTIWAELPAKNQNKLVEQLLRGPFEVAGKTTFKEEFVTCGGIDLQEIDPATMESRRVPGLFFAGEVLDLDGITGGFNFQAAWTTGYLAGKALAG
jgi:predicted Rossmann fold flavoprotein